MAKTIYVTCSFCQGMMEVKAETGEIVQKWAPGSKNDGSKDAMASALEKLKADKKKRESLFEVKKDEIEGQKKQIEEAFKQEVDRIKKEGVGENPITPFDLD